MALGQAPRMSEYNEISRPKFLQMAAVAPFAGVGHCGNAEERARRPRALFGSHLAHEGLATGR